MPCFFHLLYPWGFPRYSPHSMGGYSWTYKLSPCCWACSCPIFGAPISSDWMIPSSPHSIQHQDPQKAQLRSLPGGAQQAWLLPESGAERAPSHWCLGLLGPAQVLYLLLLPGITWSRSHHLLTFALSFQFLSHKTQILEQHTVYTVGGSRQDTNATM